MNVEVTTSIAPLCPFYIVVPFLWWRQCSTSSEIGAWRRWRSINRWLGESVPKCNRAPVAVESSGRRGSRTSPTLPCCPTSRPDDPSAGPTAASRRRGAPSWEACAAVWSQNKRGSPRPWPLWEGQAVRHLDSVTRSRILASNDAHWDWHTPSSTSGTRNANIAYFHPL